jgi:hypothetical protein
MLMLIIEQQVLPTQTGFMAHCRQRCGVLPKTVTSFGFRKKTHFTEQLNKRTLIRKLS